MKKTLAEAVVNSAISKDPMAVKESFDALMARKVASRIASERKAVVNKLFGA